MREWLSREWLSKLGRALQQRRGLDDELGEEMRAHLDFLIEENIARGMPPADARAAAQRHFGNETATRERAHEAWQFPRIETLLQDFCATPCAESADLRASR